MHNVMQHIRCHIPLLVYLPFTHHCVPSPQMLTEVLEPSVTAARHSSAVVTTIIELSLTTIRYYMDVHSFMSMILPWSAQFWFRCWIGIWYFKATKHTQSQQPEVGPNPIESGGPGPTMIHTSAATGPSLPGTTQKANLHFLLGRCRSGSLPLRLFLLV